MLKTKVWPHGASEGAKVLAKCIRQSPNVGEGADKISCMKLTSNGTSKYRYKEGDVLINYGNSSYARANFPIPNNSMPIILNSPPKVDSLANKRNAFTRAVINIPNQCIVPFTFSPDEAQDWLDDGADVVERHNLRGHSGDGIRIVSQRIDGMEEDLNRNAPLYTKYINKRREFRVHFIKTGNGQFETLIQQKKRAIGVADPNWKIRNYENGFIYGVEIDNGADINTLSNIAKSCSLGLDFGAVDIIEANDSPYNQNIGIRGGQLFFLETNTAPGISAESVVSFYSEHMPTAIRYKKDQYERSLIREARYKEFVIPPRGGLRGDVRGVEGEAGANE